MKKNKILIPALAVLALGVAGATTGTVAWFQSSVNVSINQAATSGKLSVQKSTADADQLEAQVHFFADLSGLSALKLTAWGTDANASKLYEGVVPTGGSISDVRLTEIEVATGTYKIPVKAYITDESSAEEKLQPGHNAAWADAIKNSNVTKKVTFSYANTVDSGNLLLTNEVLFYTTDSDAGYAKASEGVSGASGVKQNLDVTMTELTDGTFANTKTTEGAAAIIGYLHVRFEGSLRLHDNTKNYEATIVATAADGAAS